jgi:hypothetical protein
MADTQDYRPNEEEEEEEEEMDDSVRSTHDLSVLKLTIDRHTRR